MFKQYAVVLELHCCKNPALLFKLYPVIQALHCCLRYAPFLKHITVALAVQRHLSSESRPKLSSSQRILHSRKFRSLEISIVKKEKHFRTIRSGFKFESQKKLRSSYYFWVLVNLTFFPHIALISVFAAQMAMRGFFVIPLTWPLL